ncbi:PKD domain-containing protein [Pedobacter sp. SD-b]|uniref:PKD domain-containing protein n=1 Tax=Pedobacter segetis TaxID=2793069 RepID=A0ABS1BGE6_9SPHI|nr:PKD domain-containing protein [Pedobacter segetis]MBK0381917.1 PKD domain-containing protein [Pedobacter segetis]
MKYIFTFLFVLISIVNVNAQNISNEGTEFWLCFPSHSPAGSRNNPDLANLSVFITSKNNTSGEVTCGTNFRQTFTVAANTVTEVIVDRNASYISDASNYNPNKGIRVLIDSGMPKAVVYGHVFAGARSAATLVLPKLALGQKYFAISYDQTLSVNNSRSQFDIVCVEPDTKINITPRENGVLKPTFSVRLFNVGDVYQYQSDADITGSYIEVDASSSSCKRFAAFSGSSALGILSPGCNPPGSNFDTSLNISYDPLFQQLYPLESWGKEFPLIPFFDRNTGSIYRVLASEDNTNIQINGVNKVLNRGQYYTTTPTNAISTVTADKPVTVAEYALTQFCADSRNRGNNARPSDPDMVILNPLEYRIKDVTMYSALKEAIRDQYLNIMIPNAGVASFTINGTSYSNRFSPVPGNAAYSYAQINLKQINSPTSSFNLKSEVAFNAMAYGFGDYESYAYSAGTNLASSIFINAAKPGTDDFITNACTDQPFDFRLVLPYMATKLIWTLETGDSSITQEGANLRPKAITVNGKLLFEYRLPANKIYDQVGTKQIKIVATIPPSGGCPSGDETLNFDFEVYNPPATSKVLAPSNVCINDPVNFKLEEINRDRPIISYLWDFGDGATSTEQNPVHAFNTGGLKTIKLAIKNDVACVSEVNELPIMVYKKPVSDFSISNISCANQEIAFTNQSQLFTYPPDSVNYIWDFGDGTTSTDVSPKHTYLAGNTYQINLTLSTKAGCSSTKSTSIIINDSPLADFADPNACARDNIVFKAINTSSDIVSYQWSFGDGSPSVTQTTKNSPSHQFSIPGTYTVSLKVLSSNGCDYTKSKTILISSSNPKAGFSVINAANLCSNQPVQFKDLSNVQTGKIVKLEWVFEYQNGGVNTKEAYLLPASDSTYTHKYPSTKETVNYQVTLRAYSGNDCFEDFGPVSITVKGSPEVNFSPLAGICIDKPKITITQAKEITGIAGKGIFTGDGITKDGVFDPVIAGIGSHTISYTFTADNGCNDIKQQEIEVFPQPTADAGDDATILIGGQYTIPAKATGEGLTYQWLPSTGLSDASVLNPIASPRQTTLYTLIVTSKDGCTISDQVNVEVATKPTIPNTFTPNGDGNNDTWNIKYLDSYVNARMTIFNRFGNPVFTSIGYATPWDGRSNGKEVPVGVYYYVIDTKVEGRKFTGSVTVIR